MIEEFAEKGVQLLTQKNVEGDIRIEKRKTLELRIERSKIKNKVTGERSEVGVRVISDKRLGFAGSNSPSGIRALVEKAMSSVQVGYPDPYITLPSDVSVPHVEGIYHKKAAAFSLDELCDSGEQFIQGVQEGADVDSGALKVETSKFCVANTAGISKGYKETLFSMHFSCTSEYDDLFDYKVSRTIPGDFAEIGREYAQRISTALKKCSLQKELLGNVILTPMIASEILFFPLARAVCAQGPRSARIGDRVGKDNLNIRDDGTLKGGIRSSPIDGEGSPSQNTSVVTKGVVESLLHTVYTAKKMNSTPTGNAGRSTSSPQPEHTNFIVEPTSRKDFEGEGILIERFLGDVDFSSGNFSGKVEKGRFVKDGESLYQLEPFDIRGNSFSCLYYIGELSGEKKPDIKGIYSPVVVVEDYQFD